MPVSLLFAHLIEYLSYRSRSRVWARNRGLVRVSSAARRGDGGFLPRCTFQLVNFSRYCSLMSIQHYEPDFYILEPPEPPVSRLQTLHCLSLSTSPSSSKIMFREQICIYYYVVHHVELGFPQLVTPDLGDQCPSVLSFAVGLALFDFNVRFERGGTGYPYPKRFQECSSQSPSFTLRRRTFPGEPPYSPSTIAMFTVVYCLERGP